MKLMANGDCNLLKEKQTKAKTLTDVIMRALLSTKKQKKEAIASFQFL